MTGPCSSCLLRIATRLGQSSEHGFCIWFLKKLKAPRPIPADVAPIGCKNFRPKKPAQQEKANG